MKTNSWSKTKESLYDLCNEFSETYQIDALGMAIETLKTKISAEDCKRLEEVTNPVNKKQYRVTLYAEIEVKDEAEADNKTERMANSIVAVLEDGDILLDVELKDITEGE